MTAEAEITGTHGGLSVEQRVDAIIRAPIEHMGYRLVRVKMMDVTGRRTLQVMAERLDGTGMNVEGCAEISHTVSALLDVDDPITEAYHLEVTSPGIDRPLMDARDYERFIGFEAKLETLLPVDGRKRYRGVIRQVEAENVTIEMDGTPHTIAFTRINHAKLVLSDALIKAYQDGRITH